MTSQHDDWRELGQQLRVDSVRSSSAAGSGHPTSSMSAADLMAVLMSKYLHYDFGTPDDPRNDHLIFSKGHASPLLYAMFKAAGAIGDDEMLTFRRFGIADRGPSDAGPAVGRRRHRLARPGPADQRRGRAGRRSGWIGCRYRVWCLCGDSEMAEGSMWEAFEHAGFHGLDNLTAIIDVNRLGQTGETMHGWDLDAYRRRAEAFGWKAIEIDGHDVAAIDRAFARAVETTGQPTVIIAKTEKGHGVKAVANQPGRHGKPLDDPEAAIAELGGIRDIHVEVAKPELAAAARTSSRRPRSPCRRTSRARRRRRARPSATRWSRSARRAATSSRSTARSATAPTPSCSRRRCRIGSSRPTSPSSRWSPPRSACRSAAGSRSPRPSPPS